MSTSLSDLLTSSQNIVKAINNATETYAKINGRQIAAGINAATVVSTAAGRLATLSIVTGGTVAGVIYDATSTTDTTSPLYAIPTTPGIVYINLPVTKGIVVAPGTGQVVTVGYS